jgi:hypothetical protein
MSLRCLRIPALLILVLPVFAHAQSLGDVARQARDERQQNAVPPTKVYTNDDLARPSSEATADQSNKDGDQSAQTEPTAEGAGKTAGSKASPEKERATQELEIQKRTQEINQRYLERIAGLQSQISAAQQDLARLQRDQVESTNHFQSSKATAPSLPEYNQAQAVFSQQIEAQRKLIVDLNSQLEDAKESARHAGVPHASD